MIKLLHQHNPNEKLKVCAYCRVSTNKDEQFSSFEEQIKFYSELIMNNPEWQFAGIYSDEGISGVSLNNREGFNNMINYALNGGADVIIVKSISRFSRNVTDFIELTRELKNNNIEVYFEKESLSSLDPNTELVVSILSNYAEEESRSISKNVKWRYEKQVRNSEYKLNTWQLIGYEKDSYGNIVIDENKAKFVRKVFEMYIDGCSISQIIDYLALNEVKTPGGADRWAPQTVHNLLQNEKYVGDCRMQKSTTTLHVKKPNKGQLPSCYIENGHPAIVSREMFNRAQEVRKEHREKYQIDRSIKKKKNYFLSTDPYTGFGYCPYCGRNYHTKTNHSEYGLKKFYGDSSNRAGKSCSNGFYLYLEVFEEAVDRALENIRNHQPELKEQLSKCLSTKDLKAKLDADIAEIDTEIARLDTQIEFYEKSSSNYYNELKNKAFECKKGLLEKRVLIDNERITKCNRTYMVDAIIKEVKKIPSDIATSDTGYDFRPILKRAIMFSPNYIVFLVGANVPESVKIDDPLFLEDSIDYKVRKTNHTLRFGIVIK